MEYQHGICQSDIQLLYKKHHALYLVYRSFMSQVLKSIYFVRNYFRFLDDPLPFCFY